MCHQKFSQPRPGGLPSGEVQTAPVSCPDPTLSWGRGSGYYWLLPWLCRISNLDFWTSEWLPLHDVELFHWPVSTLVWRCAISLACSELILLTRHNQESAQWSPDPFPPERVGSETKAGVLVRILQREAGYVILHAQLGLACYEIGNAIKPVLCITWNWVKSVLSCV